MKGTRGHHTTLADVARAAGVGKTTVSRVINGAKKVSPETLKRINSVIRELGYQPSQAARSLKGGTKSIGLILPSIADPFFAGCAEAAQAVARSHEYLLIVAVTNYDAQTEVDQIESLIRHRVEGILLAPAYSHSKSLASTVERLKIPVVTLNHPLLKSNVQSVICDNRGGARAATEHLIEHGYRHIVCLGGDARLYTISERQKGYTKAVLSAGLEPMVESTANTYAEVERIVREARVRSKKVDAIFAVRNLITIYAFQAMQNLGLKTPADVALVGFDDFDLAGTLRPSVTVVRQPVERIGSEAAQLLFNVLREAKPSERTRLAKLPPLPTELMVRRSCGCP